MLTLLILGGAIREGRLLERGTYFENLYFLRGTYLRKGTH